MDIFAQNAREIDDKADPENNTRYSDYSNNYATGFKYDNLLNSAMLNGILHRITSRLKELAHCSASTIGIDIDRPARYCTQDEIRNENYVDETGYLSSWDWGLYKWSRLDPYLLKSERYEDLLYNNDPPVKAYLSDQNVQKARAMFCGTNILPRLVGESEYLPCSSSDPNNLPNDAIHIGSDSNVLLFEAGDVSFQEGGKKLYVKVYVWPNDNLREFEVRCSKRPIFWPGYIPNDDWHQSFYEIIPVVFFGENMNYRGRTIYMNTPFILYNRCRIIMQGHTILVLEGINGYSRPIPHSQQINSILTKCLTEKSKG